MAKNEKAISGKSSNPKAATAKRRLVVGNRIRLNPSNPLPISYGGNSFLTIEGKKYIPILNIRNNLPTLLLEARLTSVTQSACITSVANAIIGNGLTVLDENNKAIAFKTLDADWINWMKNVNNDLESFDEVMLGAVDGEREQGNQFIQLTKGKLGSTPFLKIKLHPMQFCRFAQLEKDETEPSAVIISKSFVRAATKFDIDDGETIPLYSPNALDQNKCWKADNNGNLCTMLHLKNSVKGVQFYGLPSSISGLRYQVLEGKSAQFNIDNLENNMVLGGLLVFKSAMTEEEANIQADKIFSAHIGDGKNGRVGVVASENGIDDVKFEQYKTQNEGSYISLDNKNEEKIIVANNWHKMLLGNLDSASGTRSNGASFIRAIWDTKEATLLNPYRRKLTDKIVMQIMRIYADVFNNKSILKYNFWFQSAMPVSFLGDMNPAEFFQVNEARELAGMDADPTKKGVYLAELIPGKQTAPDNNPPKPPENVPNKPAAA